MQSTKPVHPSLTIVAVVVTFAFGILLNDSRAAVVDFDGSTAATGAGTVFSGDAFASDGVLFSSGTTPDGIALGAIGAVFTLTGITNDFVVTNLPIGEVLSAPNAGKASGGDGRDLLMSFTTPISSLQLVTDHASELPNLVRLLVLEATGNPSEYRVLAVAEAIDNATTSPGDTLTVNLAGAPFSFALFQMSDGLDSESVDNVTFTQVPEPTCGFMLLGAALGMMGVARRRQQRNGLDPK